MWRRFFTRTPAKSDEETKPSATQTLPSGTDGYSSFCAVILRANCSRLRNPSRASNSPIFSAADNCEFMDIICERFCLSVKLGQSGLFTSALNQLRQNHIPNRH